MCHSEVIGGAIRVTKTAVPTLKIKKPEREAPASSKDVEFQLAATVPLGVRLVALADVATARACFLSA
jgi:hypothetical protein